MNIFIQKKNSLPDAPALSGLFHPPSYSNVFLFSQKNFYLSILMKSLHKILKISAKFIFQKLKKSSPIFSPILKSEVKINRVFWNHLLFSKVRSKQDILERFVVLPLIEEILIYGAITSRRVYSQENEKRIQYIEISLIIENEAFVLIIKQKNSQYILYSCFLRYEKNNLS